jgi:D-lyxose ketol-isomerase
MKRRTVLKATALAATAPLVLMNKPDTALATGRKPTNEDFYTDGAFDEGKAKEGVLSMCRRFGYPVFPGLKENLWVSDYGTGRFLEAGLAAVIFVNHFEERGSYMMLDVFLMADQMLPEHWHVEGDHGVTKNEGWLVRWGKAFMVGEGENNLASFPQIKIPSCHCGGTATTGHVKEATPGVFVPLAKMGTRHWMYGGPEGAIITEVANFHTGSAVRHSDPKINRFFLES